MTSQTLKKADSCINGERQDQYGNPECSFSLIAMYWSAYIGVTLKAPDIAILMALFKIARMSGQKWHPDNAVDACGYLAILNDRLHKEDPNEQQRQG